MTSLKVGHHQYSVEVHPNLHAPDGDRVKVLGFCDRYGNEQRILLDSKLTGARKAEVLLHEVLHAGWYYGCLGETCEEERAVDVLASVLLTIARDNPWFLPTLDKLSQGKRCALL